ncbi:hypothetical protein [Pseudooceanicola nitratireducens]|uniref:hypothetical protein n=1 Tax=Pseudooceanicola nitratireducens TaxID=517719 RepID=UPI0023F19A40|nr:hypothetical protein [Pseudooceanicola nitratireducens]
MKLITLAQTSRFPSIGDPQMRSAWTGGRRTRKSSPFPKFASALRCASIDILHPEPPSIVQKTLFLPPLTSIMEPFYRPDKGVIKALMRAGALEVYQCEGELRFKLTDAATDLDR